MRLKYSYTKSELMKKIFTLDENKSYNLNEIFF